MKYIRIALAGFCLSLVFLLPVAALDLSADKAILMDATSGDVLFARNVDVSSPPASTTKLMTALVVLESGVPLSDEVTVSAKASATEGSSIYLKAGESISVEDLLYGLLLESGNDAAIALAEGVFGSVEACVQQMNAKAQALNMGSTHFENPHGLSQNSHETTAADLARLMCAAAENADLMRMIGTKEYTAGSRRMQNHNKLLTQLAGCDGGKTGYTEKAGRCLVSTAVVSGRRYVAVTLSAPDDWTDHAAMYAYAAGQMGTRFLSRRSISCKLPVAGGEYSILSCPESGIRVAVPDYLQQEVLIEYHLPDFVYSGIEKGQKLGTAVIQVGGLCVAEIPMYAAECADAPPQSLSLWQRFCDAIMRWLR